MMRHSQALALLAVLLLPGRAFAVAACGWVDGIAPDTVGNRGTADLVILGHWCNPGADMEWAGIQDQTGSTVAESNQVSVDAGGYALDWEGFTTGAIVRARINLEGVAPGTYQVCIRAVGEVTPVCSVGADLTVQDGTLAPLWVRITGQTFVRYGATTEYLIWYGHAGNSPMAAGILYLAVPAGLNAALGFNPDDYRFPSAGPLLPPNPAAFDTADYRIIPLFMRDIPPLPATPLRVRVTWGGETRDQQLKAWWQGSGTFAAGTN